jgi:hypothetical protein
LAKKEQMRFGIDRIVRRRAPSELQRQQQIAPVTQMPTTATVNR